MCPSTSDFSLALSLLSPDLITAHRTAAGLDKIFFVRYHMHDQISCLVSPFLAVAVFVEIGRAKPDGSEEGSPC